MKRIVICICLLAVVGLLGGCFLEPAEGLYAVPKQPEEYYNLQSAIEAAMPEQRVATSEEINCMVS